MSILAVPNSQKDPAFEYDAENLRHLLLCVGEYKGVIRTLGNTERLLPMLALAEVYHVLGSESSFDELIWHSSAEPGKQKDAGLDGVIRWRDAYLALWHGLRTRPMLNTSMLQKFMAMALGRNKQVRKSAESKVSVSDRMRQVDVFLNLDSTYPVAIRSLMAADAIRRIKPFHDDGDPLVRLLPGLLIALEYELPLPLLGYSRSSGTHSRTIDEHLLALCDGVVTVMNLILELRGARDDAFRRSVDLLPARMQSAGLFDLIYSSPVVKVRDLVDAGIVKRQTAAEYLKALEDVRMLQSRAIGREMLYRNEDVVGIIGH